MLTDLPLVKGFTLTGDFSMDTISVSVVGALRSYTLFNRSERKTYQMIIYSERKLQKWTIKVEGGLEYRRRIYISIEDISGKNKPQRST